MVVFHFVVPHVLFQIPYIISGRVVRIDADFYKIEIVSPFSDEDNNYSVPLSLMTAIKMITNTKGVFVSADFNKYNKEDIAKIKHLMPSSWVEDYELSNDSQETIDFEF